MLFKDTVDEFNTTVDAMGVLTIMALSTWGIIRTNSDVYLNLSLETLDNKLMPDLVSLAPIEKLLKS